MSASKQVLVVYFSLTGNTARVARDVAARLGADIESIEDKGHGRNLFGQITAAFDAWRRAPARIGALQHDPADYALTVIATPVWAGQMTPAIRAFLTQTSGRIHKVACFITSGDTDIAKVSPSLEAAAGQRAVALTGFTAAELGEAATYENKLATFVGEITRAARPTQRVA